MVRIFISFCCVLVICQAHGFTAQTGKSDRSPGSIVFILDVSISNHQTDNNGKRFEILKGIVDSLYRMDSEIMIGLVFFAGNLWFYPPDDSLFVDFPDHPGGFVPLLQTSDEYSGIYTLTDNLGNIISQTPYTKKGIDVLKMYLDTTRRSSTWGVEPKYRPSSSISAGSSITEAFDAAKYALLNSPHDKDRQFIVFITDGGGTTNNDYVLGLNTPATFTVYYNPQSPDDLADLQLMTTNISSNGFSASNPKSDLWDMSVGLAALMDQLLKLVFNSNKIPALIPVASPTFNRRPAMQWHKPADAVTAYTLQVSTTSDFSSPIVNVPVTDTLYTAPIDLPPGMIYWRVRGDDSPWSGASSFEILDDRVPLLIHYQSPTLNRKPTLTWYKPSSPPTAFYSIMIADNAQMTTPLVDAQVADTFYTCTDALPLGTIYWKVKSDLVATWSKIGAFDIQPDSIPFLFRYNGQEITTRRPDFKWYTVIGADSYKLMIADNNSFANAIILPLPDTVYSMQTDLAFGKWFWKVSSSKNLSLFSQVDSLIIDITPVNTHNSKSAEIYKIFQSVRSIRIIFNNMIGQYTKAAIYSLDGRLITEFTPANSGKIEFVWDYSNKYGSRVSKGVYLVRIFHGDVCGVYRVLLSRQ